MTRSGGESYNEISEEVPSAIYTITKNVLGRNVTDTIAPLVREALPIIQDSPTNDEDDDPRTCTTPDGSSGLCNDLSDCPQLLLNLGNLRQSLCFKSLFVPGVCCPGSKETSTKPSTPTPLRPVTQSYRPTTTTKRPKVTTEAPAEVESEAPLGQLIVDPEGTKPLSGSVVVYSIWHGDLESTA